MKKGTKIALILIAAVIILVGVFFLTQYMRRIPENDLSVVGNTAANLNNGGLFVENPTDGYVYFSNKFDDGKLYKMKPDETEMELILGSNVNHLLAGGDYLYYYLDTAKSGTGLGYVVRTYGIYRAERDGSHSQCLDRDAAINMQLVGNYIYYLRYNNQEYTKFYRTKIDKSDQIEVSESVINPACAVNGTIYFNGTEKDHYLYALDTRSDQIYTVYRGDVWYPHYADGWIYYMDVSSDYRICRYNLSSQQVEILTNDRADTFNVTDRYLYYQKSDKDNPCLMRTGLDGSNPEVVAEGLYNNINVTSEYVYFMEYGDDSTMYHTPANGSISVETFARASMARAHR